MALSMFPGTYFCCSKGARRSRVGKGGDERVLSADAFWVSSEKEEHSATFMSASKLIQMSSDLYGPSAMGTALAIQGMVTKVCHISALNKAEFGCVLGRVEYDDRDQTPHRGSERQGHPCSLHRHLPPPRRSKLGS